MTVEHAACCIEVQQRIDVALSILAHRAWHPEDMGHVVELGAVLRGMPLDQIAEVHDADR